MDDEYKRSNEHCRCSRERDKMSDDSTYSSADNSAGRLTAETIKQMMDQLRAADPLLKYGVQKDWVCAVNPALVHPIITVGSEFFGVHTRSFLGIPYNDQAILRHYLGREVYIINGAPLDVIEYMPPMTLVARYARWLGGAPIVREVWEQLRDKVAGDPIPFNTRALRELFSES